MTAMEWIKQYESYLALVKNRAVNTVRGYVADAELLYRFALAGKLSTPKARIPLPESNFDWASFTEEMAIDYLRAIKATSKDTSVARKIYSFASSSSSCARKASPPPTHGATSKPMRFNGSSRRRLPSTK